METITVINEEWFDLSAKLNNITLTNDKIYNIQSLENQIYCYKGTELPTEPVAGALINPVTQCFRFKFRTNDVVALRVNKTTVSKTSHITIMEIEE